MSKIKKSISTSELKVGMINAKEISFNGKILLAEGIPITNEVIYKLRDAYFISELEVYHDSEDQLDHAYYERIKTTEQIEKTFVELSFLVEKIFEEMNYSQSTAMDDVRMFAEKIRQQLKYTSSIIRNIVLKGSGSDTIYRHGVNVAALSTILGKWIGLKEKDINLLTYAAVLHDFGKIKISTDILNKPSTLTQEEFNEVKNHPVIGYDYIKKIKFLDKAVCLGVLLHHEKIDGSGYPLGLKDDDIPEFARIISVADVFDAVNSSRVYKKSKGPFEALELIKEESLLRLDYKCCHSFLSHVVNYYMGENVLLNDGSICKIIQIDINNIDRPLLLDGMSFVDLKKRNDLYVEKLIL